MIVFDGMRNQNAQAKVHRTQKEIAESVGIGEKRYSQLMKGKAIPTMAELDKMCFGFGCELSDLARHEGKDYDPL